MEPPMDIASYYYAAPEAALPLCIAAADVYSLCVLSYQILSKGSLPFPDVESIRKLEKLNTKRMYAFQAIPGCSADLNNKVIDFFLVKKLVS
jgi:hypothetical protein